MLFTASISPLRCTKKLLDRMRVALEPDPPGATTILGEWYAIVAQQDGHAVALERWRSDADVRFAAAINEEILAFITERGATTVVLTQRIIGCPHEEGAD